MKAVRLHGYGDVGQFYYEDVPQPQPAADEILIKVAATSVNPVDWKLRRGYLKDVMPLAFPAILGNDVAGEIAILGAGVTGFQTGGRVMGIVNHSYAEYVTEKAANLARIPDGLGMEQAGVLPVVTLTGAQLMERGVQPVAGATVLVTGALGGVGRTAVHAAKQLGARVIAGVRAKDKGKAEGLGAAAIVAVDDDAEIASLAQVDAIADTVGGAVILKLIPKLKKSGVLASVVGRPAAPDRPDIRFAEVVVQPDPARTCQLAEDILKEKFRIPIGARLRLAEIQEAHRLAEKGGIGKVLLVP